MPTLGPIVVINTDATYSWCSVDYDEAGKITALRLAPAVTDGGFPAANAFKPKSLTDFTSTNPMRLSVLHDFTKNYQPHLLATINGVLNRFNVSNVRKKYLGFSHEITATIATPIPVTNLASNITRHILTTAEKETYRIHSHDCTLFLHADILKTARAAFNKQYNNMRASLQTLGVNFQVDGASHEGVIDEQIRTALANYAKTLWNILKSNTLSLNHSLLPNTAYSYALAGMAFGIADGNSDARYNDFDAAIKQFHIFFEDDTRSIAEKDLMRSLLVLEWLHHSRTYPDSAVRMQEITNYLGDEISKLPADLQLYNNTSEGYQHACTVLKMVWLLPEGDEKTRFQNMLKNIILEPALIAEYPFTSEQKENLLQQYDLYKLNEDIKRLCPEGNNLLVKSDTPNKDELCALFNTILSLKDKEMEDTLLRKLMHVTFQPEVINDHAFADDDRAFLRTARILSIDRVEHLRVEGNSEAIDSILGLLSNDRRCDLLNQLKAGFNPSTLSAARRTEIDALLAWNRNTILTQDDIQRVTNLEDVGDQDATLLKQYATSAQPNEVQERSYLASYLQKEFLLRDSLNRTLLGQEIMKQLAHLERGGQSLSPYYSGCKNKLDNAVNKLHEVLEPLYAELLGPEMTDDQRIQLITKTLVEQLFMPANHGLYDVFSTHRLPALFNQATVPARSALNISFAYVKGELDTLKGANQTERDQDQVIKALLEQLNTLEQASHTYWPWNYGSQDRLHSIINAIIQLKHPAAEGAIALTKASLIDEINKPDSVLRAALNKHSLFTFSAETAQLTAVTQAIIAEETAQARV